MFWWFWIIKKAFEYVNIEGDMESEYDIARDNKRLVEFIENNSHIDASGEYAMLKIVEIPDDVEWVVEEYDGIEWVAEKHRVWD